MSESKRHRLAVYCRKYVRGGGGERGGEVRFWELWKFFGSFAIFSALPSRRRGELYLWRWGKKGEYIKFIESMFFYFILG